MSERKLQYMSKLLGKKLAKVGQFPYYTHFKYLRTVSTSKIVRYFHQENVRTAECWKKLSNLHTNKGVLFLRFLGYETFYDLIPSHGSVMGQFRSGI